MRAAEAAGEGGGRQSLARSPSPAKEREIRKRQRRPTSLSLSWSSLAWVCILATGTLFNVRSASASSLEQQSVFYEEDYKTLHMDRILRLHCPADFLDKRDLSACLNVTQRSVRSFKLSSFYYYKQELVTQAPTYLQLNPQDRPQYESFLQRETTLSAYHQKLSLAQDAVDDHRVRTICLLGLRGGLALTNFLVSNPTAHFVIFDELDDARFTLAHLNIIQTAHPTRSIVLLAGDLRKSLRNYLQQFPKQTCQVLFVDLAGRSSPSLSSPTTLATVLEYSMMLVDPQFNRVLVNDLENADMSSAFQYVFSKIRTGVFCPTCGLSHSFSSSGSAVLSPKDEERETCVDTLRSNVTIAGYYKGFLPTPCVMMYANSTGGRHMEFVFSLHHCMPDVPVQDVQQPEIDTRVEMVLVTLSTVYADPAEEGHSTS